jgi:CheY-like chemotaxis protein
MDERRVLVVEDDANEAWLARQSLERVGFAVTIVGDGGTALGLLSRESFAIVLVDRLDVLLEARARGVKAPIVMMTAPGDERLAVEAMDTGSADLVLKTPGYGAMLPVVLRKVLEHQELLVENERLHRVTERRLREANALVELAGSLTSTLELKSLLDNICQAVARACEMDRCAIFSCDGARVQLLAAQFADGRRDHGLFDDFADEDGRGLDDVPVIAATIRGREAVVINDDALVADQRTGTDPRCLLALPLLSQDVVSGALLLDRKIGAEPLGASQIVLGTAIASHVALALENARLYEQAQQAVTDLKDARAAGVLGEDAKRPV